MTDSEYNSYMIELDRWRGQESMEQAARIAEQTARIEERKAIAKNLIDAGLDILLIAQVTGFTFEEIEALNK